MAKAKRIKMKVTFERATSWITVPGSSWTRNGYSEKSVDRFGEVWLKPYRGAKNLYVTIDGPCLYFTVVDGCLEES